MADPKVATTYDDAKMVRARCPECGEETTFTPNRTEECTRCSWWHPWEPRAPQSTKE